MSVYDFDVKTIDGKTVSLSSYKGKALLIVNTASQCGFTKQYKGLEELYQAYKAKGFEILAFPSNDFGAQEPGSNEEIKSFCELKYKTTFPLFAKIAVKGSETHPLYAYLTGLKENGGEVTWNFNKFLVTSDGKVVAHFPSKVEPMSDELKTKLAAALPK
ncbi:MAG: glutathione peroxidase [Archangium sp.]|nr:glutathione peroxidase [Archangium sp.]